MLDRPALIARVEADMKGRGLGLRDYAEAIDVNHSVLSRLLSGKQRGMSRTNARKLAAAIDVDTGLIDEWLAREEAMRRGRHKPGLGPTGHPDDVDVVAELRAMRRQLAEIQAHLGIRREDDAPQGRPDAGEGGRAEAG